MKLFICAVLAASAIAGCQRPRPTPLSAADLEAVKAVGHAYQDAINAEDVNAIVAVFAADGISSPPGWEQLRGHDAIRRFWEGQVTGVSGGGTFTTVALYGESGLAYDVGTYSYTFTDSAGVTQTRQGKFMGFTRSKLTDPGSSLPTCGT